MLQRKKVLIPVPRQCVDPTEVAIPWQQITASNIEVTFITPDGNKAETDPIMLTGEGLGLLKGVLAARKDAVEAYHQMDQSEAYKKPLRYEAVDAKDYDALLLPGGHDKKVKEYLESEVLQKLVVDFFRANKPVGAICHGVVLLARSIDPTTGKSVINDYKTTCLLENQEMMGYNLTRLWMKDYYLTYHGLTVEKEVRSVLSSEANFYKGKLPVFRDSKSNLSSGFVVKDRNYVSARWPGDVYSFSKEFINLVLEK